MPRPGSPSLRDAIDRMCKACIYDPGSGNGAWREQVEGCASSNCPLHHVRPRAMRRPDEYVRTRGAKAEATHAAPSPEPALNGQSFWRDAPTAEN